MILSQGVALSRLLSSAQMGRAAETPHITATIKLSYPTATATTPTSAQASEHMRPQISSLLKVLFFIFTFVKTFTPNKARAKLTLNACESP